ncbi:MAG: Nre family DNA repair protein [Candidatus Micrarchaeia archaeon]
MQNLYTNKKDSVYKRMKDPIYLKKYYNFKTIELIKNNEIYGSSPPDLFVGRIGYPDVYIGPLVPPQLGDTSIMGTPERWANKSITEIVEMRSLLIRGMYRTKVTNPDKGRFEELIKEIALSDKFGTVDIKLKHTPKNSVRLDENTQPFGPSAPITDMHIYDMKANKQIENAYSDTALSATDAMVELYEKGLEVSKIQKALSAGLLGRKNMRRFVPTRWSITATDDTLSKNKLSRIKEMDTFDGFRVYYNVALDNRWLIIIMPGMWEYESMEAWYPDTAWNKSGNEIEIGASYEPFDGRKTYAEIGGCYYAARLAVSELLENEEKQGKVIILREVHPGYIMPVGVWNVREHVRETLKKEPKYFSSIYEALDFAGKNLEINIKTWIRNSTLLKRVIYQKRLF